MPSVEGSDGSRRTGYIMTNYLRLDGIVIDPGLLHLIQGLVMVIIVTLDERRLAVLWLAHKLICMGSSGCF